MLLFFNLICRSSCLTCQFRLKGSHKSAYRRHITCHHPELLKHIQPARARAKRHKHVLCDKRQTIREYLVELVTVYGRPLNIVNDRPMAKILAMALNDDKSPFTLDELKSDIDRLANSVREKIKLELKDKLVPLMLDIVTKYGRSVLGISTQLLINDEIAPRSIGMVNMDKSHSGAYICQLVTSICKEYGIDIAQIYTLTTDNGRNVVKSIKELQQVLESLVSQSENHSLDVHDDEIENFDDIIPAIMDDCEYNHMTEMIDTQNEEELVDDFDDFDAQIAAASEYPYMDDMVNGIQEQEELIDDADLEAPDQTQQPISISRDQFDSDDEYIQAILDYLQQELSRDESTQNIQGIFCAVHTLQLAIMGAIKKYNAGTGLLRKFYVVVLKLRTPNILKMLKDRKLPLPSMCNKTRWNSLYIMVSL